LIEHRLEISLTQTFIHYRCNTQRRLLGR
jgi:hypothetical protein